MKLSDASRRFLDAPRFAVLGTVNRDGSPHLTVIWYALRGDEILFNTTAPRVKPRNLARDPRVSLLVGDMNTYVRVDGTARVVATGADAVRDIHDLGVRYDGAEQADRATRERWSKEERVSYAITIQRVYEYGLE
jgi:PPOX class probable F420-dependent enzyme